MKRHRTLVLAMTTTTTKTTPTPTLCMRRPRMPVRIFHRAVGGPLWTKGRHHHHPHEEGPAFLIHSGESFNHLENMGTIIIMRYVRARSCRGEDRQGSLPVCVLSLISVIVPRDLFYSPTILTTTAAITTRPPAAAARVVLATTTSHPVWLQPPQEGEGSR